MESRSTSQTRLARSLHELNQQYVKGEIDIKGFLDFYLRLSPAAREIRLPDNFNVAHMLKEIAAQECWVVQGYKLLWNDTPNGINQIATSSADSLRELAVIPQIQSEKSALRRYWREKMTDEFYQLILCLDKLAVCNGVHYAAINAYCNRWTEKGLKMPGTPGYQPRRSQTVA